MLLRMAAAALILCTSLSPVQAAKPAREKLVHKVYPVADLVVPIDCSPSANLATMAKQSGLNKPEKPGTQEDMLMSFIKATVSSRSWRERGGRGDMAYLRVGMFLVIDQTPAVQQQIADLLTALRREQDIEFGIAVRFLIAPESFCERFGLRSDDGMALIDDLEMFELLEACKSDRRTELLPSPKLTAFNGQKVDVFISGFHRAPLFDCDSPPDVPREAGPEHLWMNVQPVASADRRTIYLKLKADLHRLESVNSHDASFAVWAAKAIDKDVAIPVGSTAVLGGWKVAAAPMETTVPVLNQLSFVHRLLRKENEAAEPRALLVLVTPRLVTHAEEFVSTGAVTEEPEKPAARETDLERLLKAYWQACADGKLGKARKLARKALAIDPACFHQRP